MKTPKETYLEPTQEAGRDFFTRGIQGEVLMLNLLRFNEIADYSGFSDIAPDGPVSGAEAYDRYVAHTLPLLRAAGGDLMFVGDGGTYLIGPSEERWDRVMLVRHPDVATFMAFASDEAYLAGIGHRTAALLDSRLLPITSRD